MFSVDAYVRIPRVGGLWLAPDGRRLVVGVATPNRAHTRYRTSLWEVDPAGERPARQLTHGEEGEACAGFTPEGDLLFTSARSAPGAESALWVLPAAGGEARVVAELPGGLHGVRVGSNGTLVAGTMMLPGSGSVDADRDARKRREESGVSAMLHEEYPIRFWDHDLGPDHPRLVAGTLSDAIAGELSAAAGGLSAAADGLSAAADGLSAAADGLSAAAGGLSAADGGRGAALVWRDLTGHAGPALDTGGDWDLAPDGRSVVATWELAVPGAARRPALVVVDVATGERRLLADEPGHDHTTPRVSPDGRRVATLVRRWGTPDEPDDVWLAVVPLDGGPVTALTAGWERWPHSPRWTPDGRALIVAADDHGRSPLWRVDATSGVVIRLTRDDGSYTDPRISPDGRWAYALRQAVDSPPQPVRVPLDGGDVETLPGPVGRPAVPGRLEEVTARAGDGSPLRAWLAVPHDTATPAPLILWVHGGPLTSWNAWKWQSNPWPAVARGYAVLMPDPALSTGYGTDFLRRGWGDWGRTPYADLMAITDAVLERPDLDPSRTAVVGASYGGFMANWIAGHTGRFGAIVSHASMWALDQMMTTTDMASYWLRELTPARLEANSPHRSADAITTPMLVIHGDRDHRVPIGEALRLWWDLRARGDDRHRFLYFPDEGHKITRPGNLAAWYSTLLDFLDHHVREVK